MIGKNPLVVRYRQSQRRNKTWSIYSILYGVALALLFVSALPNESYLAFPAAKFATNLYGGLWAFEVALYVWAAFKVGRILPSERSHKSYDFFRLLPLSPRSKVLGLIVGEGGPFFVLAFLSSALRFVVLAPSHRDLGSTLVLLVLTTTTGLFLSWATLLGSTLQGDGSGTRSASLARMVVLLTLFVTLTPLFVASVATLGSERREALLLASVPFFGLDVPGWIVGWVGVIVLWGFAHVGAERRFVEEDEPLFTARGAVAFVTTLSLLGLGLLWSSASDATRAESLGRTFAFLLSGLSLSALTSLFTRRSLSHYLEDRKRLGLTLPEVLVRRSNWLATLAIVASPLVLGTLLAASLRAPVVPVASFYGVAFAAVAMWTVLFELLTLYEGKSAHAVLVLTFTLVLYTLVPALLSGVFDTNLYAISGIDLLVVLAARATTFDEYSNFGELLRICGLAHLVYAAILTPLVLGRVRALLGEGAPSPRGAGAR